MRFDKYKSSGIEWIGDVPSHWSIKRVKDIVVKIGSGVTPKGGSEVYINSGVPLLRSQNVYDDGLRIDDVSFIDEATHNKMKSSQLKPNDILINITGASIGRTCIVPQSMPTANINQHIIFLRLNKKLVPFISNYFKTYAVKEYINLIQAGTSKEALNMGQTLNVPVILPPLEEQKAIGNFLENKTQVIDKKINLLTKKADYYKELNKSIINNAVCNGLDKNVKLKESGIEWIGKIPQHWYVKRIKECIRKPITDGPHETPEFVNNGYPFISVDGLVDGELYFDNCRYISKTDFLKYSKKVVIEKDDIFIGKAASTGKIARVKVNFEFTVWSPIAVVKLKPQINSAYIEFVLKSNVGQYQIDFFCTHNTQSNIAMKDIPLIQIPFPPNEEQSAIADYLDEKTQKLDAIVSNIQKQIETLKELRKTLINDVVTGKIKVTK